MVVFHVSTFILQLHTAGGILLQKRNSHLSVAVPFLAYAILFDAISRHAAHGPPVLHSLTGRSRPYVGHMTPLNIFPPS